MYSFGTNHVSLTLRKRDNALEDDTWSCGVNMIGGRTSFPMLCRLAAKCVGWADMHISVAKLSLHYRLSDMLVNRNRLSVGSRVQENV